MNMNDTTVVVVVVVATALVGRETTSNQIFKQS